MFSPVGRREKTLYNRFMANDEIVKLKSNQKQYSKLLREIPDKPKEIYCRGNIGLLNNLPVVAIVGSRRATDYGLKQAHKIAFELSEQGVVIVSGLAFGIDAAAHRGALDAKGQTIAVLGSAIDNIQPMSNRSLGDKIIVQNGLVVSEYAPGSQTHPGNFPQRNRIIAGLSQATIIIEAAEKSGALITTFLAADYNREVFALPGNVDRINSRGTNYLIKSGANCLTKAADVLSFLGLDEPKNKSAKLKGDEATLAGILEQGPLSFDALVRKTGFDATKLNVILMNMEIKGAVRRTLDGCYGII